MRQARAMGGALRWLWVSGVLLCACGSQATPEASTATATTGSGPSAPGPAAAAPEAEPEPVGPAPNVVVRWLPDGSLSVQNHAEEPVALARAIQLHASPGAAPERVPLAVDCARAGEPANPTATPAGAPAAPATAAEAAHACLTIVPGAELVVGRWPSSRGDCRCPPCLELGHLQQGEVRLQTCDGAHTLSAAVPAQAE
jgi:hypothetical protein